MLLGVLLVLLYVAMLLLNSPRNKNVPKSAECIGANSERRQAAVAAARVAHQHLAI